MLPNQSPEPLALRLQSPPRVGGGSASLDRFLQTAWGMRGTVRLARGQNPSLPPNSDFSDQL
jgi:hypothetical protein